MKLLLLGLMFSTTLFAQSRDLDIFALRLNGERYKVEVYICPESSEWGCNQIVVALNLMDYVQDKGYVNMDMVDGYAKVNRYKDPHLRVISYRNGSTFRKISTFVPLAELRNGASRTLKLSNDDNGVKVELIPRQ